MKIALLCFCILGIAFAVPVHRSARSASDSSSTENDQKSTPLSSESDESEEAQTKATTTEDSDSDDDDDDDDDNDLPIEMPTDAPITVPFTPAFRGDNTGRGDSVAYELRAAPKEIYNPLAQIMHDTTDEDTSTPDMESQQQLDDSVGLPQAGSSSHRDGTVSTESNSQEENKSQPDVSVEDDSHPDSHASNESTQAPATPATSDSNESHNSAESQEATP
uniref:Osteopontin isoform X1 n=1 Tax=Geotrypetes seraphini TaxID=260995 RepID=A0A6P8SJQ9_GEOSA|nr:osteopontin isoform X1 [Geotrypetes seraphini]XP_033815528.1 osteopontin isoform X1 [Geotrypetes seraphini]XP_033815536.1 osteopontin isoform X2 [Geotrypetes seraphini]